MTERAVIFDVGGVLIDWDMRIPFRRFMDEDAIDRFLDETRLAEWNQRFDGGMTFAEGIETLSSRFPHYAAALKAFDTDWITTIPRAIEGSVDLLASLKQQGVPRYAITNFSAEKWPIAVASYPFLAQSFIDVCVSGQERVMKPDAAIYELLLARNGLSASTCIFIDDSAANIAGAEAVGIHGIAFTSAAQLRAELTALGVLRDEKTAPFP